MIQSTEGVLVSRALNCVYYVTVLHYIILHYCFDKSRYMSSMFKSYYGSSKSRKSVIGYELRCVHWEGNL